MATTWRRARIGDVAQLSETSEKLAKSQKDSDMIEILYTKVFGVAEFENEGKSQKFQMADLKLI